MKIMKYLSLVLVIALTASCEKHELEYNSVPLTGMAEFQLHYVNPVTATSANNIYRIEVNDSLYGNRKAPLNTYNAVPSGGVGRFFTVEPGSVNLKLYQGSDDAALTKVYDQNVTLTATKQNVFVHDFNQPPVVFENGYPFSGNTTTVTDSTAWVKFYNFLYETAGVPYTSTLKIQYQYLDSRTNQPVNIGSPVAFGEATGWMPVTVVKLPNEIVAAGSRVITFNMRVVDASGNDLGKLQIMNTSGAFVDYTATATLFIGRRYHHIMAGYRGVKSPNSSVRVFTAL